MRGIVLRQDGEVGEIAKPGDILSWVGQPQPLLVVAEVNEEDMPRVEAGQRALLRPDAYPERSLEAVVDSITPKGDPATKTYRVRLALPETTPLLIGMTVEVSIVVDARPGALLLPAGAVLGDTVYVVEPTGRARRRELEIGFRGTSEVEILSGIDDAARVTAPRPVVAYGNVYVARIAMGANPQQTLLALREAEAYAGPSLILAYSHCIAHGINIKKKGLHQQKLPVHSGN